MKIESQDVDTSRIRSLVDQLNRVVNGSMVLDASQKHEALQASSQLTDILELPQTACTQHSFDVSLWVILPSLIRHNLKGL